MDDFESMINEGLRGHARELPSFEGNVDRVKRRGQNRRWVSRGAGAFGR